MKLLNKNIDMISWTAKDGTVTPVRFRMEDNGEIITVKVDRILQTEKNRFGGSQTLCFLCSSIINGIDKIYELSCNCDNQKWLLKKI
ncbi:hypothetical protein DSECCO2_280750 [anaerobic digester metagenome]